MMKLIKLFEIFAQENQWIQLIGTNSELPVPQSNTTNKSKTQIKNYREFTDKF